MQFVLLLESSFELDHMLFTERNLMTFGLMFYIYLSVVNDWKLLQISV